MDTVYDLWFVREYEHRQDTKLHIGIYASEADALAVIETLKDKPGFRDYPEGFEISHETGHYRLAGRVRHKHRATPEGCGW